MRQNKVLLLLLFVVSIAFVFSIVLLTGQGLSKNAKLGERAVQDLYQFRDVNTLDANMSDLKSIVTEGVFEQLTIDNIDRSLNTYLKFKNEPSSVEILESNDRYILYSLKTKNIDESRVFIFMYEVDSLGKICKVREAECLDFVQVDN